MLDRIRPWFSLVLTVGLAAPAAAGDLLYDVSFSSPPHVVGQLPVTGMGPAPRAAPTVIGDGDPLVVAALGGLDNQPCSFGNGTAGYDQLRFSTCGDCGAPGFATSYERYFVELEVMIADLAGPLYQDSFSLTLDLPSAHSINFHVDGTIRAFAPFTTPSSVLIGIWEPGIPITVGVDVDVARQVWRVLLDGQSVFEGAVLVDYLRAVRVTLMNPDTWSSAAIDDLTVYAESPYECQPDLGFGGPGEAHLSLCGAPLATGGTANFELTDAEPNAPALLIYGPNFNPTPIGGGMLVPTPPAGIFFTATNALGAAALYGMPGGGGPAVLYAQFAIVDPEAPSGFAFSNALRVQLLP